MWQKKGPEATESAHFGKVEKMKPSGEGGDEGARGCVYCGKNWHPVSRCPAREQRCFRCRRVGLFVAQCREKPRRSRRWNEGQGEKGPLRPGLEEAPAESRRVGVTGKSSEEAEVSNEVVVLADCNADGDGRRE